MRKFADHVFNGSVWLRLSQSFDYLRHSLHGRYLRQSAKRFWRTMASNPQNNSLQTADVDCRTDPENDTAEITKASDLIFLSLLSNQASIDLIANVLLSSFDNFQLPRSDEKYLGHFKYKPLVFRAVSKYIYSGTSLARWLSPPRTKVTKLENWVSCQRVSPHVNKHVNIFSSKLHH